MNTDSQIRRESEKDIVKERDSKRDKKDEAGGD